MPPQRPATAEPAFCSPPCGAGLRDPSGRAAAAALGGNGGRQGAVLPDAGAEAGGHHVDVEHGGVGRMDAADDRCHQPVQHPPAHPGPDQRGRRS